MQAVPVPHKNTFDGKEDLLVADPLSEDFDELWNGTARKNTQIFQEIFKTVPSNNVRSYAQYDVSMVRFASLDRQTHQNTS